jgi:hypothetical protein
MFIIAEEQRLNECYGVHIGRILKKYCSELGWLCVPEHIDHAYSEAMSTKTEMHPLQVGLSHIYFIHIKSITVNRNAIPSNL